MKTIKLQKTHIFFLVLISLSFIACVVLGYTITKTPNLLFSSVKSYKFFAGIKLFCKILPAITAAAAVIGWTLDFGSNQDGCRTRFSDKIFFHFKKVLISSIFFVALVLFFNEIILPSSVLKMQEMENLPKLLKEYQHHSESLYEKKDYDAAYQYAILASELDSSNQVTKELLFKTELASKENIKDSFSKNKQTVNLSPEIKKQTLNTQPYTSYSLLLKAKEFEKNQDWFNAHYNAQMALQAASAQDINISELKSIAAKSWNMLNQGKKQGSAQEQQIYAKKFEGYTSLLEGDFLKSYYIFKTLSMQSKKLSADPDVVRYLKISETNLENNCFFTDETMNLQGFESSSNVYFSIFNKADASTSLFFIKGITPTKKDSLSTQYLRGMTIVNVDATGNYRFGIYAPYAKMTSLQTKNLAEDIKKSLFIEDSIKEVPYVFMSCVDRTKEGMVARPELKGGYELANKNKSSRIDFSKNLILPIEYSDFALLKKASNGADSMDLISLISFIKKAENYGFSQEIFEQNLMNRLLFPLFLLSMFIVLGIISWNCRTAPESVFKFRWIIMIPILAITFTVIYDIVLTVFKLANYGLFAIFANQGAIISGIVVYCAILILSSIAFVSCRNAQDF